MYTDKKKKRKQQVKEKFPFAIVGARGWAHPGSARISKWPKVINPRAWGYTGIGQMSLIRCIFSLSTNAANTGSGGGGLV